MSEMNSYDMTTEEDVLHFILLMLKIATSSIEKIREKDSKEGALKAGELMNKINSKEKAATYKPLAFEAQRGLKGFT